MQMVDKFFKKLKQNLDLSISDLAVRVLTLEQTTNFIEESKGPCSTRK